MVQRSLSGPVLCPCIYVGQTHLVPGAADQGRARGFVTWAWGRGDSQTLTLVFLVFPLRIHSKEHFKEKYAVDAVQYADEVSSSRRRLLSEQLRAFGDPFALGSFFPHCHGLAGTSGGHRPPTSPSAACSFGENRWETSQFSRRQAPPLPGQRP